MVSRTRIDDDGAVRLPLELRRLLDLRPGDRLLIEERDGAMLLRRDDDAAALGEAGRHLAAETLAAEDFSDWDQPGA